MSSFPAGPLLRHYEELHDPGLAFETGMHLSDAEVVLADYELLQADFPELSTPAMIREFPELEQLEDAARREAIFAHVDAWLLRNAAIVSTRQIEVNEVNTPIPVTGERVRVARPSRYGRALVVSTPGGGLLDIKGAGVMPSMTPSLAFYRSGLMFLGEALADYSYQRVIDAIFRHCGSLFWTLPTYAILSLGFDIFHEGQRYPAGLQVRRAHRRPLLGGDLPSSGTVRQRVKFEIEMILRHYGLTSCNPATTIAFEEGEDGNPRFTYARVAPDMYSERQLTALREHIGADYDRFEGVNIQMIREVGDRPSSGQIVDFGHFEVRERFEIPVVSLVSDRVMRWGGAVEPESEHFVQPDPDLTLPLADWASDRSAQGQVHMPRTARHSPVDLLAYELAGRLCAGEITRAEVRAQLDAVLDRATAHWGEPWPTVS